VSEVPAEIGTDKENMAKRQDKNVTGQQAQPREPEAADHRLRESWRGQASESIGPYSRPDGQDPSSVLHALQERDAALRAVFDATTDSIMLLDREGGILQANTTAAQRLGLDLSVLLGRNCFDIFPQGIVEGRRRAFAEVLETGAPVSMRDQRAGMHFEVRLYPVFDQAGEVRRVAVYAKDISESVRAEQAGQRLRERVEGYRRNLEAIFSSLPEGLLIVAPDMTVLEANNAFERISGTRRSALLGRPPQAASGTCLAGCLKMLQRTLDTGQPVREYRFECRDEAGRNKVAVVNTAPLEKGDSRFAGAVLILRDVSRLARLETALARQSRYHGLVGRSEPMREVFSMLDRLSGLDSTVLLLGESGTGKELAAEALHRQGPRSRAPLVRVNCAALSEELLESELFGHVQGAYTGALRDRVGRFQAAEGGTIFLDEIGDISVRTQLKLLRFLESREYERVGESSPRTADVRVVAATNADLVSLVRRGRFREDLYYRLKVMVVPLPPLRHRTEDIPLLVDHFVSLFRLQMGKEISGPDSNALELLMSQSWPGNVRELRHAVEHACILCPGGELLAAHFPPELRRDTRFGSSRPSGLTREQVLAALEECRWNRTHAARALGISRSSLYRRIADLGIVP
jgi:PAS domain S-box-containing protein